MHNKATYVSKAFESNLTLLVLFIAMLLQYQLRLKLNFIIAGVRGAEPPRKVHKYLSQGPYTLYLIP